MKCSECGHVSDGNFCPKCGAPLSGAACPGCGAPTAPGARFCTHCGEPLDNGGGGIPWRAIAATAVLAIVVVAVVMAYRSGNATPSVPAAQTTAAPFAGPAGSATAAGGTESGAPNAAGAAGIDPLAGGPRAAADKLFNRIMGSAESGDTSGARFFVPMALEADQMAAPLDNDGLYHVALIQLVAGEPDSARATAQQILDKAPHHLLALAVAAQAEADQGKTSAARTLYQQFLDNYAAESGKTLPEYQEHAKILPIYRQDAEKYLGR
ncbi:MAG: zinc ribbon domain-containing protein [Gemmatimonadota bacterium]